MRGFVIIIAILTVVYPVSASAVTGLGIGGKIGYGDYKGDVLPQSGDVGSGATYGLVLAVGTLPLIDFEIQANYFTTSFNYSYDIGGVPVGAEFDFRDFNVIGVLKKNLISFPGSPFAAYIGIGAGAHVMNTDLAITAANDPANADDPFELIANVMKMSGHGLAGARVSLPAFPLSVFGEVDYGVIFDDQELRTFSVTAGAMLKF